MSGDKDTKYAQMYAMKNHKTTKHTNKLRVQGEGIDRRYTINSITTTQQTVSKLTKVLQGDVLKLFCNSAEFWDNVWAYQAKGFVYTSSQAYKCIWDTFRLLKMQIWLSNSEALGLILVSNTNMTTTY